MRIRLILAAISLGLAPVAASGQAAPAEPEFSADAVRAHVDFLADDLLEGRETGTRGFDIAAHYVATRFEALGLRPGAPGGGWFQPVPLAQFAPDPARPGSVTIGATRFASGEEEIDGREPARAGGGTQALSGGAVFVGYGLDADYAGLDLKGRFAVALIGLPRGAPEAAAAEDKLANAVRHGAIGLISLVTPEDLGGRFPWEQVASYLTRPQITWLTPAGVAEGENGALGIQFYLGPDAAPALFAGSVMTADKLFAAVKGHAPAKSFALAQPVVTERTSLVKPMNGNNVIGVLPGSDPALAAEYVVLSAHLDHLGIAPGTSGDRIYNGAMDNAAGVATMLEAARAFVESGRRPRRSILFVALTGEEEGLLGSQYLAHYPVTGSGRVVADVNLDMPILLYDFTYVVAFGAEHSTMGPIVQAAAAKMGVALARDPMPEENFFVRSDHYSFVQAGVPSVFLMTGFANGGEKQFRDFLAHHYHQVSDQTDLPFDWAAGAKFAKLNYLIAREIADGDQAPRWYAGDEYGDRFAPGQPRAPKPGK